MFQLKVLNLFEETEIGYRTEKIYCSDDRTCIHDFY